MRFKKGDTLIEVLLAFSIFSAAMVGGLWMMNNAMSRAIGATQITWARNAMDAQAEALRYINSRYLAVRSAGRSSGVEVDSWRSVTDSSRVVSSATDLNNCPAVRGGYGRGFVIDPRSLAVMNGANINPAENYPRLVYSGESEDNISSGGSSLMRSDGLWIEVVKGGRDGYYDFHIRACWIQPGQGSPTTLGTIVRLYDAR